jgi:hypothetical protein
MQFLYKNHILKNAHKAFCTNITQEMTKFCIMKTSSLQYGLHYAARQLKLEGYKKNIFYSPTTKALIFCFESTVYTV